MDGAEHGISVDGRTVLTAEIDDRLMILVLADEEYLLLNPSARELWSLLVEGTSHQAMVAHLARSRAVPADRASELVKRFVTTLDSHGVVCRA